MSVPKCDIHGVNAPIGGICNFCIAEEEERVRRRERAAWPEPGARRLDDLNRNVRALTRAMYVLTAVQRFGDNCPDVAGVLRLAAAYERAAKELP